MSKRDKRRICVADIETDPFLYGNTPIPFAVGFWDGELYVDFWGDDCMQQFADFMADYPEDVIIYMHNGGGFDFWYMQDWITNPLFFIKTRIAKCGFLGRHELRDSYKMIPVPLSEYQKDNIDYQLFWYPTREKPKVKAEIRHYLKKDCEYLRELVIDFVARYGMHLTIGSAAIHHLKKLHPQNHESEAFDARFRPYYMGGRNQAFRRGEIKAPLKVYDVNSMYPYVMSAYKHPLGGSFAKTKRIPDNRVSFSRITAESNGALPLMDKGLKFPHGVNDFWACSHEIHAGIDLGILRVMKVHECLYFNSSQSFEAYIDRFSKEKIAAEERGDKGGRLYAKLFMNNAYGKFGQDPRNYTDCMLFDTIDELKEQGYKPTLIQGTSFVGTKQSELNDWSFNNVAVAASITSASRAELMRGIAAATNPVYCDTDSIICESLNMVLHDTRLGAWKTEAACDSIYIAGKKMYACYDQGQPLLIKGREKKACKGVNMSAALIKDVAMGQEIVIPIDAPSLKFGHDAKFIARNIRATY